MVDRHGNVVCSFQATRLSEDNPPDVYFFLAMCSMLVQVMESMSVTLFLFLPGFYSLTHERMQVWDLDGTLLGKIFTGKTCGKFAFAGPGKIVMLAETEVYLAEISPDAEGVLP